MKKNISIAKAVEELHSISNKPENISRKKELLLFLNNQNVNTVSLIRKYHDTLLFLLAYPENEELFVLTGDSLQLLSDKLKDKGSWNGKLDGSGIIHSKLITAPSFDLLKRLHQLFPNQILIDSSAADKTTISKIFKLLLPAAEQETIDKSDLNLLQRIHQLRKGKSLGEVEWLLQLFSDKKISREVLDHLFNSLELYVSIELNDKTFSRTRSRSLEYPTHFHGKALEKHVDAKKILDEKIKKPIVLKRDEAIALTDTARLELALLMRETDPVTNANQDDIEWHDMGRGFRIALFGMTPDRRLAFDSYIGYMAFKNGIPAAYGGAWMFGDGAKVGVNIFEPLRGGESAWTFCQILRLYRQRFGVKQFVVEPYQYGKHNSEGIKSGAFWFYYRLGFRPMNEELKSLAEKEATWIREKKSYRSSAETLLKFTHSNISLLLSDKKIFFPDTEKLSLAITKEIANEFSGDRGLSEKVAQSYLKKALHLKFSKWSREEKEGFRRLSLLFILVPGINGWKKSEKVELSALLKARGGKTESDYIQLIGKCRHLLEVLCKV